MGGGVGGGFVASSLFESAHVFRVIQKRNAAGRGRE